MQLDASAWSGDGPFTQLLIDALREIDRVDRVRVEDAPSTREGSGFSFISNEIFVTFRRPLLFSKSSGATTLAALEAAFTARDDIGAPDYSDRGMLQYLRTERIVPPYQTRAYKQVELVRVYVAAATGVSPRDRHSLGVVS